MNINNIGKSCCGCSACYNRCPVNAISMQENEEGFLYPVIDVAKCTNCGLCVKNCPVLNPIYKNNSKPKSYAVMANDEIRYNSSSGGVFPVLAYSFIEQGGYVAGAVWHKNGSVKHIVSNEKEDIEAMRGSKYLQSCIGDCYKKIKGLLSDNKKVLFTGTPCQIAGLYAYLQKEYENLHTLEIICHGTPSPKVFKKYLEENLDGEEFVCTNFRDKKYGWSPSLTTTTTTTTIRKICRPAKEDDFMNAFLKNLCLRSSCGDCKFNKIPRQADITTGDFWKIDKYNKKYNDQKGTSVVLVNNKKGKELFEKIKTFKLLKNVPLKYAIKGNPNLVQSSKHSQYRQRFFDEINVKTLKQVVNLYGSRYCDYLIVNFWDTLNNYGACLTAYAMQEFLSDLGFIAKFLETGERTCDSKYDKSFGGRFAKKYLYKTEKLNFKKAKKLTENIKGVILGSDQVLRLQYMNKNYNKYLLNFVDEKCRKLAISPSFGLDKKDFLADKYSTKKNIKMMKDALKSFDYLSCREISGKELYKDVFNLESDMILDPVFLVNKSKYDIVLNESKIDCSNKIVNYILDKNESQSSTFEYLSKELDTEVVSLERMTGEVTTGDWLKAIRDCRLFVTDSFHGACFALLFNKPFYCLKNKNRGSARFDSLIEMFDIENNFISSMDEIKNKNLDFSLNWIKINSVLESERNRSLEVLKKVLLENHSNNTKALNKVQRISACKKYVYKVKILLNKINKIFRKKKKEKYNQKINAIKHLIDWGI